MSGYVMKVDIFGNAVRCETDGLMVSLNDVTNAGNLWRLQNGAPIYQLAKFLESKQLAEYIVAASEVWDIPADQLMAKAGKGKTSRTMAHISIAILLAEQISPKFHATVHKVFIEGKLLEFREYGGTEFRALNSALDAAMMKWEQRNAHKGHFIQVASAINKKLLHGDQNWNTASVAQTHQRYEVEQTLVKLLELGVVRDWEHLKELIEKV